MEKTSTAVDGICSSVKKKSTSMDFSVFSRLFLLPNIINRLTPRKMKTLLHISTVSAGIVSGLLILFFASAADWGTCSAAGALTLAFALFFLHGVPRRRHGEKIQLLNFINKNRDLYRIINENSIIF
jgi:hypothetical protein